MQESILLSYSGVLFSAYSDWFKHLISSPKKLLETSQECRCTFFRFVNYFWDVCHNKKCPKCININPVDHRFKDSLWSELYPFNLYSQLFLSYVHLLDYMSTNVPGVTPHNQHLVNFTLHQLMDSFSPSNFPCTNPVVIKAALRQSGMNFIQGYLNYFEDGFRKINHQSPVGTEEFKVGVTVGITPGKVIYRNKLIELIQYTPTTNKVFAEPILIVPAWIMKYYILDLSPYNSLVKFLVEKGHTVFMISWKNPASEDRNLGLDDYINFGIMDALKVVNSIIPNQLVHCTGYCIGGTLLMLAAALMSSKADNRIKSITLFAAQIDFIDAGELRLFIDEAQIQTLEITMQEQGYLSGEQMASCFSALHAIDLIWSRYIQDYLLGTRYPLNDMMAWNHDVTRLPYRMHSEYLRKLYLNNELSMGKFKTNGVNIKLSAIKVPIFAVSTVKDHVAPWKSVYKIHKLINAETTYVLTGGGHNSGVISEPGHKGRSYQMLKREKLGKSLMPEEWLEQAPKYVGSWWLSWEQWLADLSVVQVTLPTTGNNDYKIIGNAPGTYVLQR